MNIADQIYKTMYDIMVVKLLPSLTQVISNLNATGFFKQITVIAIMVIGLLMIYGKMNRVTFVKSFISIFIVYSLFVSVTGNIYLLESLRSLFIDGPIEYGSYLVNTISAVIYQGVDGITHQTINIEPGTGSTAFGKLWQISTDLASAVWDAGGLSDIGAFFIGAALYAVAIFLLVAQIMMLGAFLIMSVAAIFAAPLFIPFVLFNATRQMFQSWVGFGLGGAFGLIMLMIMMGIIFGFVSITFMQVFGIDLSTGDVGDIDDISDMGKIGSMVVFMLISIKLLPKIEMWASSLAGASAAGISDASMAVGSMIGRATGLTAKVAGKQIHDKGVKPAAGAVKRGLGRAVNRLRNRSANSKNSNKSTTDTKQKLAQAKLKNAIRTRLVNRGQDQKRPLDQLSQKEQGISKKQTLQNKKNQQQPQNPGTKNSQRSKSSVAGSRGLNKNVKKSSDVKSNKDSKQSITAQESTKGSAAERPIVSNNNTSKGSVGKTSSEKTSSTQTNSKSSSNSSSSIESSKKTSVTSSKSSTPKTTNSTLPQGAGNTSSTKNKSVDRNTAIKQKQAQARHKQNLESLQKEQEIKRREPSKQNTKKKKKGDDE